MPQALNLVYRAPDTFLSIVRFYISKFVDIMDGQFNTCTKSIRTGIICAMSYKWILTAPITGIPTSSCQPNHRSQKLWERESLDKLSPTCRRHLLELNSRRWLQRQLRHVTRHDLKLQIKSRARSVMRHHDDPELAVGGYRLRVITTRSKVSIEKLGKEEQCGDEISPKPRDG